VKSFVAGEKGFCLGSVFNGIIFTDCALASCCLLVFDRCLMASRTDQARCDILLTAYHLPSTQLGPDNAHTKWSISSYLYTHYLTTVPSFPRPLRFNGLASPKKYHGSLYR
jgi:hypothetical protein